MGAGIGFSARGNVAVAGNTLGSYGGESVHKLFCYSCQRLVLLFGKWLAIGTFQLNPDGKIVTFFTPIKT